MKHALTTSLLAAGAAALGAMALSGCGAGNSNNPNIKTSTTTTTTTTTSEIVYVADQGNIVTGEDARRARKSAVSQTAYPGSTNENPALEAYTLSITSGVPTASLLGSSVATPFTPLSIAVDSSRQHLFVLGSGDGYGVAVYSLNSATGAIGSQVASAGVSSSLSTSIHSIAVAAPNGAGGPEFVYVASDTAGTIDAFKFTGSNLTSISPTGASSSDTPYTLAADPTGSFLYSGSGLGASVTSYTVSPTTGALTAATQSAAGTTGPVLVVTNPQGSPYVYAYDEGAKILYAYQRGSGGALTLDGNYPSTSGAGNDLAISPSGNAVFLSNGTTTSDTDMASVTEATISANGTLNTPMTTASISGSYFQGITVDATGEYVGALDIDLDALEVYPLSGTVLGTPQSIPLSASFNPVAAVFEPNPATSSVQK